LAEQLTDFELGLIQVPYSLNVINESALFSKIYHFADKIYLSLRHPFRIFAIQNNVDKKIKPNCHDTLLVHTDMDLLNQYIIQRFYMAKSKIYLLEDGAGTMCTYNLTPRKASAKNRFKTLILRNLYNYKFTKIAVYGVETLPLMNDYLFSGVIVNYGNSIMRNIPLYKLTPIKEPIEILYESGAIFFHQPLYIVPSTEEEYLRYLSYILDVSTQFTPFYFKFHPSEKNNMKLCITKLINERHSNIIIIEENDVAENIINKYPVRYAITFNSTAALNLINKGIVPIFLNNLFNDIFPNNYFDGVYPFLKSINCQMPAVLSDVRPGFCAFPYAMSDIDTYSIVDILNKH